VAEEAKKEKIQKLEFSLEMELVDKFQFNVKFDIPEMPDLITDEPIKTGGEGKGPNPSRLVGTAVANCLSASLLHCLRRSKVDVEGIKAEVNGLITRNDEGLLRIKKIDVTLKPRLGSPDDEKKFERCKSIFEKYCIVTDSLRQGLAINVDVEPKFE
jgi:uncharacterized OsmC-like protein